MGACLSSAETCTTQSRMAPAERDDALYRRQVPLQPRMQAGDAAGLRALSVAEVAKDFAAISEVVGTTAPKLKGGILAVDRGVPARRVHA